MGRRDKRSNGDELDDAITKFPALEIARHTAEIRRVKSWRRRTRKAELPPPKGQETYDSEFGELYLSAAHFYEVTEEPAGREFLQAIEHYGCTGKYLDKRLKTLETRREDKPLVAAIAQNLKDQQSKSEYDEQRAFRDAALAVQPEFETRNEDDCEFGNGMNAALTRGKRAWDAHKEEVKSGKEIENFGGHLLVISSSDLCKVAARSAESYLSWVEEELAAITEKKTADVSSSLRNLLSLVRTSRDTLVEGLFPREAIRVPDTLEWRQRIARGEFILLRRS